MVSMVWCCGTGGLTPEVRRMVWIFWLVEILCGRSDDVCKVNLMFRGWMFYSGDGYGNELSMLCTVGWMLNHVIGRVKVGCGYDCLSYFRVV